jgi:molybdopterin molybdotransferase
MGTAPAASADACAPLDSGLIALADAVARITALARPIDDIEHIPLADASGRVLAHAIAAPIALPVFDNSAMDGFAVATAALAGSCPYRLPVVARTTAGDAPGAAIGMAGAVRIFTGAPLPPGVDAVVMQEDCDIEGVGEGASVVIHRAVTPGLNIRRHGEDVTEGTTVLAAGTVVDARHIAITAALGLATLPVRRRTRVALLSTGNELRNAGESLPPGAIYESNRPMLGALLRRRAHAVTDLGACRDEPDTLAALLLAASRDHDVILTSGGVSVGEEDHLPAVLHRLCQRVENLKIGIKPGKPAAAGRLGDAVILALPGNPFSALVSFLMLAVPLLARVGGAIPSPFRATPAVAAFADTNARARDEFIPVRIDGHDPLGRPRLICSGPGGSHRLSPLLTADGLTLLPKAAHPITPGDPLAFYSFAGIL